MGMKIIRYGQEARIIWIKFTMYILIQLYLDRNALDKLCNQLLCVQILTEKKTIINHFFITGTPTARAERKTKKEVEKI